METLEIKKENALTAYKAGGEPEKKLLRNLFGEKTFSEKITDRVKTFEDACEVLGIRPEDVLHSAHSDYLETEIDAINAFAKLTVIVRALNEGWKPDWNNSSEYKYYPWFNMESGSGLSYLGCGRRVFGFVCRLSPLLQNKAAC
jgi:hypothetical protein